MCENNHIDVCPPELQITHTRALTHTHTHTNHSRQLIHQIFLVHCVFVRVITAEVNKINTDRQDLFPYKDINERMTRPEET